MNYEVNKKGNIIIDENNVMLIMKFIAENNISNVRYYLSNDLGIIPNRYYSKVKEIAIRYPKFYNYYEKNLEKNINNMKEKLKYILLYIGTFMKYGIELEDGTFRNFDIFDWYNIKNKYFDNLNRNEISKIIDELSKDPVVRQTQIDMFYIRKLISQSYNDEPIRYSFLMHRDSVINDKLNGLTEEENIFLVDFMEENNIPLSHKNYAFGVNKMFQQRVNKNDIFILNLFIEETNEVKYGRK